MSRNNQNEMTFLQSNSVFFNESIATLKQSINPQLTKVKSKHLIDAYSHVVKDQENQKILLHEEKNRKIKNHKSGDYQSKTILEYTFIQEYSDNFKTEEDNLILNNMSDMKKDNSYYEKSMEGRLIVNRKIEEKRKKKKYEELASLKISPGLSQNTKRIIEERFINEKPLHMRYQEEMEFKKMKVQDLRRILRNNEEDTKYQRSKTYNKGEFDDWVNSNQLWARKREAKVEYNKKNIIELEGNDEDLVFKPTINKTSEIIASIKNNKENPNVIFFEKLYKKHEEKLKNIENIKNKLKPSFQPKVNKYPSYLKNKPTNEHKTFYFEVNESKTKSTNVNSTKPNKQQKSSEESKTLSKSKSTNVITTKNSNNNVINGADLLYKLNLRNETAWKKQVNYIKTDKKSNDILNLSLKYGKPLQLSSKELNKLLSDPLAPRKILYSVDLSNYLVKTQEVKSMSQNTRLRLMKTCSRKFPNFPRRAKSIAKV